jgi:hypothetical protein
MIANVNIRVLGNGAIFVQYQEDGKSKDAAFPTWEIAIKWLHEKVQTL